MVSTDTSKYNYENTKATIDVANIMVGDPLDWPVHHVGSKNGICSSFDECLVPFYEFLFTQIGLQLSFSDFEVVVLKHLKVNPSQLHLEA